MAQLAIYIDETTARQLDEAAANAGMSRSAWVRKVIQDRLLNGLPDSWFANLGTWEDDRTPEEILRDIRSGPGQRERPPLS